MPKVKKRAQSATFKPNINEFQIIIKEAIRSRLYNLIKTTLKNNLKSYTKGLKKTEEERKRVLRYTYVALDEQYGPYWIHHSIQRLKLNDLTMYTSYVKEQFDNVVKEVKNTLTKEIGKPERTYSSKYSSVDDAVDEQEQINSIVVPLSQVLRKDLPIALRPENNRVQMDSILPREFRVSSTTIEFPVAPTTHANNDAKRQSDYKTLFMLSHLQVINTLKFGVSGIQKETQNNYPLWIELTSSDDAQTVQDNDVNKELQEFV
ncbi:hypothetical protein BDF21DRAFT_460197 [Thamnidium elegans]|nr:hypothetical protein BDF21DRAFT_460197 [Thamnidium elegans]